MKKNLLVGFLLVLIIFIALSLRLINLSGLPIFVDEAIYVRWSQIMASEATLRFLPLSDGKQPLFMWILMLFVRKLPDPLITARLISVFSGIGTIMGIFALCILFFKSKKVAILGSMMWAISPYAVFFDRLALVDSLLAMLGIWAMFFGFFAAKTKRLDWAMISGFFLGLAALTKSPALFFAILLPSVFFSNLDIRVRRINYVSIIKITGLLLVIYTVAFGMYNILRLGPNFHLLNMRNYDYVYPYSHILTDPLNPLKGHLGGILSYFVFLAPLGLGVMAILGILGNLRNKKNSREVLLLATWIIFPILIIAEFSKVVTARYLLFVLPFVVVLSASVFDSKNQLLKKASFIFFVLFIAQSIYTNFKLITDPVNSPLPKGERSGYLEEWTAGQGIKEISDYVKNQAKNLPAGRQVVIGTEGYFGTLPDGLQIYLDKVENVVTIGVGLGINELPLSLKESKDSGNKTYLVINKSRFNGDPKKMGLKLISQYPKAPRRPESIEYAQKGPQEILYFFEVN